MSNKANIHETAIIDPSAKIANDVVVGPYCVIGPNVEIGSGSELKSHVVVTRNTKIGKNNTFHQFGSIGSDNQDLLKDDKPTYLEIGDNNVFHECVTINRGSIKVNCLTKIGNHNFIMAYAHVGHDSVTGDYVILTNGATLAGHVDVHEHAIIGAYCAIHQYCTVGAYAMVSLGAMVNKDVLPYLMVSGNKPRVAGLNIVGLTRKGFSKQDIQVLQKAYKIIFRQGNTTADAIELLQPLVSESKSVQRFIEGLKASDRGIVR